MSDLPPYRLASFIFFFHKRRLRMREEKNQNQTNTNQQKKPKPTKQHNNQTIGWQIAYTAKKGKVQKIVTAI